MCGSDANECISINRFAQPTDVISPTQSDSARRSVMYQDPLATPVLTNLAPVLANVISRHRGSSLRPGGGPLPVGLDDGKRSGG